MGHITGIFSNHLQLFQFIMDKQAQMDLELKKAFGELQQKMVDTSQKLKLADMQIETHKRSMTHAQLTEKEIIQLPLEVNTYESLGRMFVMKRAQRPAKTWRTKSKHAKIKLRLLKEAKPIWKGV